MKSLNLLMYGICIFLLISCKKNKNEEADIPLIAVPREHGTSLGVTISKVIGPEGGSLESGDGRMSMIIPAGAVNEATPFSIEYLTNSLELGTGLSYRLLPENVNFNKEVELRFNYSEEDIQGTSEDFLFLVYQDAEGYWHRARKTIIDKTSKVLKVNTKHFSDWSVETSIRLVNKGKSVLTVGETTNFAVLMDPGVNNSEDFTIDDLLGPIYQVTKRNIKEWKVFGKGSISGTQALEATYKAPAAIGASSTDVVEATVINILDKIDPTQYGSTGTLIIRENVQLEKEEYFYWSVKGSKFSGGITVAQAANGRTALSVNSGVNALSIQFTGQRTGSFSPGDMDEDGKLAVIASLNGKVYQTLHTKCGSNEKQYGQGSLSITKYGEVGGFIEGTLSVGSFHVDGCDVENGMVLASFRLKRKA